MGHCISLSSKEAHDPEPVVKVGRLSYSDKALLNTHKVESVPSLLISSSAIYKRRNLESLNDCEEVNKTAATEDCRGK